MHCTTPVRQFMGDRPCGMWAARTLDTGEPVCWKHFEAWRKPILERLSEAVRAAVALSMAPGGQQLADEAMEAERAAMADQPQLV